MFPDPILRKKCRVVRRVDDKVRELAADMIESLGKVYVGVDVSLTGALISLPYAFVDAGIGGFLIAWLYNKLNK